jgi:hypothetical protein
MEVTMKNFEDLKWKLGWELGFFWVLWVITGLLLGYYWVFGLLLGYLGYLGYLAETSRKVDLINQLNPFMLIHCLSKVDVSLLLNFLPTPKVNLLPIIPLILLLSVYLPSSLPSKFPTRLIHHVTKSAL